MKNINVCNAFEVIRWVCVIAAIQICYFFYSASEDQLRILMWLFVIPMAGLTGIESIFFADAARSQSGYAASPYQRQSGINNLSIAIASIIIALGQFGPDADFALIIAVLIFLMLSGCNHAWSAWKEGNHYLKNILRPIMSLLLFFSCLPILINYVR